MSAPYGRNAHINARAVFLCWPEPASEPAPALSVVAPMYNEAGGVLGLVNEIAEALAGIDHEIIIVDDHSDDETASLLENAMDAFSQLRVLRHGENAGQSRAIRTGVLAARAPLSRCWTAMVKTTLPIFQCSMKS